MIILLIGAIPFEGFNVRITADEFGEDTSCLVSTTFTGKFF